MTEFADFRFDFDYSFLTLENLEEQCISKEEIEFVFYQSDTVYSDWHSTDDFGHMIGFSLKNKFISFTFALVNDFQTVRLVDAYLPYEKEIRIRYFNI